MARGITVYSTSIPTFTSLSAEVDLGTHWDTAYLVIQSMTSNSQHHLKASETTGGTFRRVQFSSIGTSSVQTNDWAIASSSSNACVALPQGLRFIKVETTAICSFSPTYSVIVSGN